MIVNKYNQGGGGSGSGVTPQDVQRLIDTSLAPYWDSAATESAITEAVSGKADAKILIDFDHTSQAERAALYADLYALYDGGSGATINKLYDFYKTVNTWQGLKIDYYGFSGDTLVFGKVVSPENMEDQVVYEQVVTINSEGNVEVVTNIVGGADMSAYWTSAQTEDAISAATSGKADAANTQANTGGMKFPLWNTQGVITGLASSNEYRLANFDVNGTEYKILKYGTANIPGIYAPLSAGTAGDILVSTGGTPVWSAVTIPDMTQYTPTSGFATVNGSAITEGGNIQIEAGSGGDADLTPAFPRMPHLVLQDYSFGDDTLMIANIKSALFDDSQGGTSSGLRLGSSNFGWLNENVEWYDTDISPEFTIDTQNLVAYIENIPAGEYTLMLGKWEAGEHYDSAFTAHYFSKEESDWSATTIETTVEIWNNPDVDLDQYWRTVGGEEIAVVKADPWGPVNFIWSFPKDVERFEIAIADDGNGEYLSINTTYKEYEISGLTQDIATLSGVVENLSGAVETIENHLYDVEEVTASALTELHNSVLELSGRPTPDMTQYTPTSGFATVNGSAITNGGNIVIQGGGGGGGISQADLASSGYVYFNDDGMGNTETNLDSTYDFLKGNDGDGYSVDPPQLVDYDAYDSGSAGTPPFPKHLVTIYRSDYDDLVNNGMEDGETFYIVLPDPE